MSSKSVRKGVSANGPGKPFWLPGSAYYLLAFLIAFVLFLGLWGILLEGEEEFALYLAASSGGLVFLFSIVVREVFLRRSRERQLMLQRQFDEAVRATRSNGSETGEHVKISVKQNAGILKRIKKKSDAARELGHISKGHFEVFDLCSEYLLLNKEQIENANPGSPRLGDLRKGREFVKRLHHFHLLAWAEIESTALTAAARDCDTLSGKFSKAREALKVIESALRQYPSDTALRDSETAVLEFIASLQLKNWFDTAEQQASAGDYIGALSSLKRAAVFLDGDGSNIRDKDLFKEKLELEIQRISVHARTGRGNQDGSFQD